MGRRDHGDYGSDHSHRRDKQCEFGNRFISPLRQPIPRLFGACGAAHVVRPV